MKEFEEIAQETISKASKVKCSIQEYIDGLELITEEISVAIDAANMDLKRQEEEGDDD
jgi:hypothetical protein